MVLVLVGWNGWRGFYGEREREREYLLVLLQTETQSEAYMSQSEQLLQCSVKHDISVGSMRGVLPFGSATQLARRARPARVQALINHISLLKLLLFSILFCLVERSASSKRFPSPLDPSQLPITK